MKFEFATVEVKKFDLADILTVSGEEATEAAPTTTEMCNTDNSLPCVGD